MAKLILRIDGKNIKDIKMTQNGKGHYIYSSSQGYLNVIMQAFEEAWKKTHPGYKKYTNGSHSYTDWGGVNVRAQRANDIVSRFNGRMTASLTGTVIKWYRAGRQSFVCMKFTNGWSVWLVHSANDYVKIGTVIKAGQPISDCVWNHFHIFMAGSDFWSKYINQFKTDMKYKKGMKLRLTGDMNIRKTPGGAKSFVAKNNAVGLLISDGETSGIYDWYKIEFADKTGWIADTSLNKLVANSSKTTNADATIPKPPPPDECDDIRKENEELKTALSVSEGKNAELTKENEILTQENEQMEEKVRLWDNLSEVFKELGS